MVLLYGRKRWSPAVAHWLGVVIFVRVTIDSNGMVHAWIDGIRIEIHILIVETIHLRQTICICFVRIGQVLAGLVKSAAAILGRSVRIIQASHITDPAHGSTIIDAILNGKDRFRAILSFGDKVLGKIRLQTVLAGADHLLRQCHYFL